ncbi:MAG: ABC transporter ATP-binding protein [Bacteroidetes bacterium]|nr:MAG: ABC transporter ATP-binding protein [Bacteroidota bacterium]
MIENYENKSLIGAVNLSKTFNKQKVLKNVSIDFNAGERISLSGPNGAGKTTLIRCILGQYTYEGELNVLGLNPQKHHEDIMKEVGFVPQIPPPLKMTVKEMFDFFSKLTDTPSENFLKISTDLGLMVKDNYKKPFLKLSGGMKQKLLVAFALGRNPKILLMDEPSANLDPKAREVFFDYLKNYDKDTLMILSSHRISEISVLVNRAVEMDLGEVIIDKKI